MPSPHVIIIGGGFGGLSAARALARAPVRVTLLDRRNHHVFQPLLYQVATAALSPADIASPIRWILRRQADTRVLLADVQSIDVTGKRVVFDGGEMDYDYLILATGAAHAYFGHEHDWAPHAPGLKTLDDALAMRRKLLTAFERAERESDPAVQRRLLTFVIVGGGPTGVELAGALAEIARHALRNDFRNIHPETSRIVLVEAGPHLLSAFPATLQQSARRALERLGVDVRLGAPVTAIGEDAVRIGEERIETGTILWAAGVSASALGRSLGAQVDRAGRVQVNADLTAPGRSDVFVVGDLATTSHQTGSPLPGVAQVAIQGGRAAARNILRAMRGEPLRPFHYRDKGNMATIGRAAAICDLGWLRLDGFIAWLIWLFVHIFFLIGFRNRVIVLTQWAWSYMSYQRSVRLILGASRETP